MPDQIPVKVQNQLQNLRLLELPEELLQIVTSTQQDIYFTSSSSHGEGNLHLTTDDKSWLIKQVSTSNSVYITRTDNHALKAFAKPTNILEVHAIPTLRLDQTIVECLSQLVPRLERPNDINGANSLRKVISEIPAPHNEIKRVLTRECVCENNQRAFIPSSTFLLGTWKRVVDAATMNDVALAAGLDVERLMSISGDIDDDAHVEELQLTVARRLFETGGYFHALELIDDDIKEQEMARWVGNLILRAKMEANITLDKEVFEKTWDDHVPAAWVKYCSVEILGNGCEVEAAENKERVIWQPFSLSSQVTGNAGQPKGASNSAQNKKRKWHEKFAAQRNRD